MALTSFNLETPRAGRPGLSYAQNFIFSFAQAQSAPNTGADSVLAWLAQHPQDDWADRECCASDLLATMTVRQCLQSLSATDA